MVEEIFESNHQRLGAEEQESSGWLLDTHLHLHPGHDAALLLRNLAHRLISCREGRLGLHLGGILLEMPGGSSWDRLKQGTFEGARELGIVEIDGTALRFRVDGSELFLFSGFQVTTREKIEVLALLPQRPIASGMSLHETAAAIEEANGIVVLPWSPGKWLGRRGVLVRDFLGERPECWVGDIPMRWWGRWQTLKVAGVNELRVLYGSDPLPISGDEGVAGTLASHLLSRPGVENGKNESEKVLTLLRPRRAASQRVGPYQQLAESSLRWLRVMTTV